MNRGSYEGIDDQIRDAEIIIGWSLRPQDAARNLRWIHLPRRQYELLFPELVDSDVMLTNGRDVNGPVVAEHVMTFTWACQESAAGDAIPQARHFWAQEDMWNNSPYLGRLPEPTWG